MRTEQKVVNINILGRDYPVRCTPEEALELQEVEKDLNDQLNKYRLKYAQLDKQDCLSMALIENQMAQMQTAKDEFRSQCLNTLDHLDVLLDKHLD